MKNDIQTKEDIKNLVNAFYELIKKDDLLGPIFNDVSKVDWENHLPIMYAFWENAIFFTGIYVGNPLKTHQKIHSLFPLKNQHFERWNELFIQIVDSMFKGEKAELTKTRAMQISKVLQDKLARVDRLQNLFE